MELIRETGLEGGDRWTINALEGVWLGNTQRPAPPVFRLGGLDSMSSTTSKSRGGSEGGGVAFCPNLKNVKNTRGLAWLFAHLSHIIAHVFHTILGVVANRV